MAKQKTGNIKNFSFSDLNSELNKIAPDGSILTDSTFSEISEYIDTGNYIFNAQISGSLFGGYPNARSVCVSGESGCITQEQKIKVYVMRTKNQIRTVFNEE